MTTSDRPLTLARWELRPRDGGEPIRGDLRARPGPPPRTVVLLCHGFKGFKDWGFFPPLARALARRGHAALSFNLSGSGVGADGIDFSALDRFARQTHSRNLDEIRMVLDAVADGSLFPEPPERIGLFGHSRGGGEAILAAADDGRVDALVTWSAIARVQRWSTEQVAAWERGETIEISNARTQQAMPIGPGYWRDVRRNERRLDILRAARRVRAPWLIVHGEDDESVAADDARELLRASGGRATLRLISGAGHTFGARHPFDLVPAPLEAAADATLAWFDRHLLQGVEIAGSHARASVL